MMCTYIYFFGEGNVHIYSFYWFTNDFEMQLLSYKRHVTKLPFPIGALVNLYFVIYNYANFILKP